MFKSRPETCRPGSTLMMNVSYHVLSRLCRAQMMPDTLTWQPISTYLHTIFYERTILTHYCQYSLLGI